MKKDRRQQFSQRMAGLIGMTEAEQLLEAIAKPAAKSVRYNRNQCPINKLEGTVVPWNQPYGRCRQKDMLPSQTPEYAAGMYYIQEASAMLAISAASKTIDFSDKIVLDLTAAPGGKATQAAELIISGYLVANEVIKKRVAALTWNINRQRLNNVIVTSIPTALLTGSLPGFFDIVIVDAPCSGEGLFQKGKHSPANWSEKNVLFCARRQKAILRDALSALRPGGYLVYSTCTFAREENEDQVEYLLKSGLVPVPFPADLQVSPAITGNKQVARCSGRIFPHREGGAGAFVAILQKDEGGIHLDDSREYAHSKSTQAIIKPGHPVFSVLDPQKLRGFFYERKGIISHFPNDKIPEFLFRQSFRIGAPILDRLRDDELMFGAVRVAAPEAVVEVSRKEADLYISGRDIRLDLSDGWYFVSFRGMILGPIKVTKGSVINKFPKALVTR
jgi:16S rRNA C967 or C1407 C5-methylase (RsmB/RsmF family)